MRCQSSDGSVSQDPGIPSDKYSNGGAGRGWKFTLKSKLEKLFLLASERDLWCELEDIDGRSGDIRENLFRRF